MSRSARPPAASDREAGPSRRAQANVVGVAILVGLTMLSLGALTATVGTVVDSNAAAADADRVADDLDAAIRPVEATGPHEGRVAFTDGRLRTANRSLRVLENGSVVAAADVGGLVYESGRYRVVAVGGAVVRDHGGSASMAVDPPLSVSRGTVLVGVADLGLDRHWSVGGGGTTRVRLATDVTHERRELGDGTYAVAVETDAPEAWERYFERLGADVERRRFEGDEHPSVVARFDGERTGYLVVHELDLEVRRG